MIHEQNCSQYPHKLIKVIAKNKRKKHSNKSVRLMIVQKKLVSLTGGGGMNKRIFQNE